MTDETHRKVTLGYYAHRVRIRALKFPRRLYVESMQHGRRSDRLGAEPGLMPLQRGSRDLTRYCRYVDEHDGETHFMVKIAWCRVMSWFRFWTMAAMTSAAVRRVAAQVLGTESRREKTTSSADEACR